MPNNKKFSPDQIESVSAIVKKNSLTIAADQVFVEDNPTAIGEVLTITGLNTGSHSAEWQPPTGGPPSGVAGGDLDGTYPSPQVDGIQGKSIPATVASNFLKMNALNTAFEFVPYGTGANTVAEGNHTHSASAIVTGQLALARGGTAADLSATGGANQFVRQSGVGAAFTVSGLVFGDIPALALPIVPTSKGGLGLDASASTGLPFFDAPGVVTVRNAVADDVVDLVDTQTFLGAGTVSPPKTNALVDASGASFILTLDAAYASRFVGGGVVWVNKITAANTVTVVGGGGDTIEGAASDPLTGVLGKGYFRPDSGTNWRILSSSTGGGGAPHALLSATHTDTSTAAPVRGDLIVATSAPLWARFAVGAAAQYLRSTGLDPAWSGILAADLPSGIDALKISSGLISNAEFDFLNGVTSNIQTQIDGKVPQTRTIFATAPIKIDAGAMADLSANRTLSVDSATTLALGVIKLANHLNGTALLPSVVNFLLTGHADAGGFLVRNHGTPIVGTDVVNKTYVDTQVALAKINIEEGDAPVGSGEADTLDFNANHFNVTEAPANEMNVAANTGANGLAPLDGTAKVPVANLPSGTTTAQGIVELATDAETAANVVVQGNDSRLPEKQTLSATIGMQTLFTIPIAVGQFMKVKFDVVGNQVGGGNFVAYETQIFAGRIGVLPAQQIGQVQESFNRESHGPLNATATISGNNIIYQVNSLGFTFNWTGFAFKVTANE